MQCASATMYPENPRNMSHTASLLCFFLYSKKTWSRSASTTKKCPLAHGCRPQVASGAGRIETPVASVARQNALAFASAARRQTAARGGVLGAPPKKGVGSGCRRERPGRPRSAPSHSHTLQTRGAVGRALAEAATGLSLIL